MTPEHKALVEHAIAIIQSERECLFEGHQVDGVVRVDDEVDQIAVDAMAEMDAWLVDARAALSSPTAQTGEAVAWLYDFVDVMTGDTIQRVSIREKPPSISRVSNVRPLYTHPAPAVPEAVEALSLLEEIGTKSLALRHGGPDPADLEGLSDALEEAIDLAMRAHAALAASHMPVGDGDYFGLLVTRARQAAKNASAKFPQPNYVTLKIAEEAGEVVRGAVHYAENRMEWSEVEGEIVQLLAMLIRFVTEGDLVNGIVPPLAASTGEAGR